MKKITFLMICLMATFFASAQYTSMAIVGDGAGGWPTGAAGEVDANQMTSTDGINWSYDNLVTSVGSVKFRAENMWGIDNDGSLNWGAPVGGGFPTATAVVNSSTNIGTGVGVYDVTFNSTTLVYNFIQQNVGPIISLIGSATNEAGNWETDIDLGSTDGIHYSKYGVTLFAGAVKFRKGHDWPADGNWAPLTFPSGIAVLNDPGALEIAAGTYNVTFNLETLEYAFNFPKIALVGSATPQGWPNDPQTDLHELTSTDGVTYVLNSITLIDGAAKFRQDNNWAVQWGGDGGFPSGTGSQNGTDIPVTAGIYSVTLNKTTGAYVFGAPIAGTDTFEMAKLKVYPNPTQNSWNFVSANETITNIVIVDMLGKTVLTVTGKSNEQLIDASGLSKGVYIAKIATAKGTDTMKLVKN
jgi:hypothetical protein